MERRRRGGGRRVVVGVQFEVEIIIESQFFGISLREEFGCMQQNESVNVGMDNVNRNSNRAASGRRRKR